MTESIFIMSVQPRTCEMLCTLAETLGLFPPFRGKGIGIEGKIAENGYYVDFNPHQNVDSAIMVADLLSMEIKFSTNGVLARNEFAEAVGARKDFKIRDKAPSLCEAVMKVAETTLKARGMLDADFSRDFGMPPTRISVEES